MHIFNILLTFLENRTLLALSKWTKGYMEQIGDLRWSPWPQTCVVECMVLPTPAALLTYYTPQPCFSPHPCSNLMRVTLLMFIGKIMGSTSVNVCAHIHFQDVTCGPLPIIALSQRLNHQPTHSQNMQGVLFNAFRLFHALSTLAPLP